jgi:peptide/nickel transport system substrate-binding protein
MIRTIKRVSAATALALVLTGGTTAAQKAGGILRIYSAESPPGLSIYEQATPWGQGPLMGVYNNLILFDQHVAQNSLEAIRPDLATKWSWNEDGTELTFTLRQGVRWHDGMQFTAKDVLCTVDLLLDRAKEKVRFNPRKSFYKNLASVSANGDYEATFHLSRPQPAFPMLLANGFAAITPCHQTPDQSGSVRSAPGRLNSSSSSPTNTLRWRAIPITGSPIGPISTASNSRSFAIRLRLS